MMCRKRIVSLLVGVGLIVGSIIPSEVFAEDMSKSSINLTVDKKIVNGFTYNLKTYNKVKLKWNKVRGTDYYKVYKYDSSTKKYSVCEKVKGGESEVVVRGLGAGKTYLFKIRAYGLKGKYVESKPFKVKVYNNTDGYFYDRSIWSEDWGTVLVTEGRASDTEMGKYSVRGNKPVVKYNYSTRNNKLYIHVYAKFKGEGVNSKFEYYKKNSKGKYYKDSYSSSTYRSLVESGIKACWNMEVRGNKYDFIKGCNFNTVVVLHTGGFTSNQRVINISIGDSKCNRDGSYWFWGGGFVGNKYDYRLDKVIYLPTQYQLSKNKSEDREPVGGEDEYKISVAHEICHCFGLNDAYDINVNGKEVKRMTKSNETGRYGISGFGSIMYDSDNVYATANDLEMILQAQGMSAKGLPNSVQSYRTFYDGNIKYIKSSVIRK